MQDEYFTLAKRVEEPLVRYTGEMADSMARFVPERPSFMAKLPTVSELVDNQLKFRKRFVEEQTMFVRKMMKAMDPMVAKVDAVPSPTAPKSMMHMPAKSTATRMAPRRVARKAA
ncbi:MAG: hypothetical protein WCC60_05660 [Ilumatobacteraceae bacterium]